MALPVRRRRGSLQPSVDESGRIDWGAFATVDFDRLRPEFDKARYKAERLKEQLGDLLILVGIVKERLPGKAKYLVLKHLRMGIIDMEHIISDDMLTLARLHLRARRLQEDITRLQERSKDRARKKVVTLLEP